MTRIKICGLSRLSDISAVNACMPDYAGFVFAPSSRRFISCERAAELKAALSPGITAVGVFVDEDCGKVARLLNGGVIDMAQLHGSEDDRYIERLKGLTDKKIIRAFRIKTEKDAEEAEKSRADYILLDSGAGSGKAFDWRLLRGINRQYFLAGGLSCGNAENAVRILHPFAVDVSSGVETDGYKDKNKIAAFVAAVREADGKDDKS